MAKKDPNFIRYLGWNEQFEASLYFVNFYNTNNVICRYVVPDAVSMRQDTLGPHFDRIIARTALEHAVLQLGLGAPDAKKSHWVHLDSLDLQNHVTWVDATATDDYESLFAKISIEQREKRFPSIVSQPRWRIVVIKDESRRCLEIVFSYAHAHADGISGKIFHETLLRNFNTPEGLPVLEGRSFKTNTRTSPPLPPHEKLAHWTKGLRWTAGSAIKELRLLDFKPRITDATWAPFQVSYSGTHFRTITIPKEVLSHVLAACRSHDTTLTGLINALVLVSLSRRLSEKDARGFQAITPVSTRYFLKPSSKNHDPPYDPDQTMGNLVSVMNQEYGPDVVAAIRKPQGTDTIPIESLMDVIWTVSANVRRELKNGLDLGLKNNQLSLMSFIPDWRKFHLDEVKAPRASAWIMSNLGVIDGNPPVQAAGGWKIDKAHFQLSIEVTRGAFHVCPIAVKGRDLTIDVNWQDGIVDNALGDNLFKDIEMMLLYIGGGP
ncbi:alcohol acetyltransferase-domain-containing protein [Plectosphaerella plurivora]|uniref:Alcohol acetyltransferase-domain-containing protein n=1 Tax=Plectosphaerella plurivora TaxID=936078 RepID=A0A9P8V4Y9_9PEZI|nr:alcohol acetyltransferase-domain-containing protein [Plectosphaerella plurivora]